MSMLVVLMWGYGTPFSLNAQEAPAVENLELDEWRGASLGIRIETKEGQVFVEEVHEHVAESCPLLQDDLLVSVGGEKVTADSLDQLGVFLATTMPDTFVQAEIERDGETKSIQLPTYRRELVDIPAIVNQLRQNRVIQQHLNATDREEYMDQLFDRMVAAVTASESPRHAAEGINAIIDEIDVSHTALLPRQSYAQLTGGTAGDLGLTLQRHQIDGTNRYFVIDRMPGSIGYESDIVLGDEITGVNGVSIEQSRRLILSGQEHRRRVFFLAVDVDEQVNVEYRRRQNSEAKTIMLKARDAVPAEDVVKLSSRVITSGNHQYGYIRFWNLMSMNTSRDAQQLFDEKFADCDMLILDLRGRGGLIPAVLALARVIKDSDIPVIAITDDLTRSAKEMLSQLIKQYDHVTVIGQRTAGAVTGATMMRLPSGNGLMFPVVSSESLKRFTGDVILERVGVAPDIEFDFQLPWCGGNDRLLEAAIETADKQIREFLDSIIFR